MNDFVLEPIVKKIIEHTDTRIEYTKVVLTEKVANIAAKMAGVLLLLVLFLLFYFFFLIGVAYFIGNRLGSLTLGFLTVAGFHLLLFIIVALFKNAIIEHPIKNSLVKQLFK